MPTITDLFSGEQYEVCQEMLDDIDYTYAEYEVMLDEQEKLDREARAFARD